MPETPPLTRGRPASLPPRPACPRNTPAYAGKTVKLVDLSNSLQKHPCLRGEDDSSSDQNGTSSETPPLTRGRRPAQALHERALGNTPAYAGKTRNFHRPGDVVRKHPRLRGEDANRVVSRCGRPETPPLTRGRQALKRKEKDPSGNTPAYAGKTDFLAEIGARLKKHPRLRGEDSNILYKDQSHNTKYAIINCSQRFPLRLVILT